MKEEYQLRLEGAKKRLLKAMEYYDKAGVATMGDFEIMIDKAERQIATYTALIEAEEKKEHSSQNPSQATIYCYVFTTTLGQTQVVYSPQEQAKLPAKRYGTQEADWHPFYNQQTTIGNLLKDYQASYPIKIVYWKSQNSQYIALDNHLDTAKALAVLDWMAMQETNMHGFLKFDSQKAPFVAPICEQTRAPFHQRIQKAQGNFPTIQALRAGGLPCEMNFFDSSNFGNFCQDLHRLFNKLSSNIQNQSQDTSPIRNLNMNFL
ncbi:MAG: hypothetical protein AB8E82_11435 [Aureispira sp.]